MLNQKVVVPILHYLLEQPKEMTLPDERTQPISTKPTMYPYKNKSPNSTFPIQRYKKSRTDNKDLDRIEVISPAENIDTQDTNNNFVSPEKDDEAKSNYHDTQTHRHKKQIPCYHRGG